MGSPESWSFEMTVVAWMMLPALLAAFFAWLYWGVLRPQTEVLSGKLTSTTPELIPALSWVVGAAWLWHTKPEVWFTYYLHLSFVVLVGVTLRWLLNEEGLKQRLAYGFGLYFFVVALLMTEVNVSQADRLGKSVSWNWDTFSDYVNCVDERLTQLEKSQANRAEPFQVWCPTYPDITIELSRRHPHWELTRTNDFHARNALALQHGQSVDAVVITEMIRPEERQISSPWSEHPEVRSVWMDWQGYYLHSLDEIPGWKPNRYLCQRGRWQAFIYMN